MFGRLKDFRRIATRYDRLADNFLAAVCLAATVSVSRGGASVMLTERSDVGRDGQVCVWTIELATLLVEWSGFEDVVLEHGPTAMPWGLTEIAFRDPDGNRIRVAQPTGCQT